MNGLVKKPPLKRDSKIRLQGINRALLYPKKKIVSQYNQRIQSQQHFEIRQNQLNSKFMIRKKRLETICKQNKNIYIRINTQKSQYAREDLNKSYRSSSQISKRLSRCRALSRESSTSGLSRLSRDHSFTTKRRPMITFKTPAKPLICETLDVNRIDEKRALDMKILFGFEKKDPSLNPSSNKQNNHSTRCKLPKIKERPSILTERNKFDIYHIKEEMEEKYPKIFKTIPVKSTQRSSQKRIRDIFS